MAYSASVYERGIVDQCGFIQVKEQGYDEVTVSQVEYSRSQYCRQQNAKHEILTFSFGGEKQS
jgi:hypothetical protein